MKKVYKKNGYAIFEDEKGIHISWSQGPYGEIVTYPISRENMRRRMCVEDLIREVYFHDSGVIKIRHIDDTIILRINLCMWMQEGYKEGEDELKEISLKFESIKDYIWDSKKTEAEISYSTILKVTYSNGVIEMILLDNEISIISFKCNTVEMM